MKFLSLHIHHKASRADPESEEQKWAREHPFGEYGSPDYWIEAMKRAFALGETRAEGEIERLVALSGPQPPTDWLDMPSWFCDLWPRHLAPYSGGHYQMPY